MPAYTLSHVSDEKLLADLGVLVATDRRTLAALLAHLAEVDARELFLPAAYSSMFAYCTRALHLSDDAALKRIRAARFARRFPQLFEAIADGRLHLTGTVLLGPHLTDANVDDVIAAATHRTKADLEILVARLAPQPDLPAAVVPIDPVTPPLPHTEVVPGPPPEPPPVTRTKPLSPEQFGLQVTISQETRDKLQRAQALMRHRNASGDLAVVIDRALDALLAKLEKKKFGATSRPRAASARRKSADPSYVSNDVRRAVHERDGEQCAFVSANGTRCTERGFLEHDHVTPRALGGPGTALNTRYLCSAHNQYEAERVLGVELMERKRKEAAARRRAKVGDPDAKRAPDEGSMDADVQAALTGMGFKPAEARQALAAIAQSPATTLEDRLRAALAELDRRRRARCKDGVFDVAWASTETPIRYGKSSRASARRRLPNNAAL